MTGRMPLTCEEAQSRAWGTFFFVGFGSLWMLTGLHRMGRLSLGAEAAVFTAGLLTLLAGIALMRRAARLPRALQSSAEAARVRRVLYAVNIIQWVAVATAVVILLLLHLREYIVPAIGAIVGLHLFPLATAYRYPMHRVTAAALVLWCGACILLLPRGQIPAIGAFVTSLILLGSAALTLGWAWSRAGRTVTAASDRTAGAAPTASQ